MHNDLYIYGDISDGSGDKEGHSASEFMARFKALEAVSERINIHINSTGGYLREGIAIYNLICHARCEVHTYIDGCAMSMAGVIALAGSQVFAYQSSLLHLHSPLSALEGNAWDLRAEADSLDAWEKPLLACVAQRTGKTIEQVKALYFDYKEHLFSPQEALAQGLIDQIVDIPAVLPKGVSPADMDNKDANAIKAAYKKACNKKPSASWREWSIFNINKKNKMTEEEFITLLGLPAGASAEQIKKKVEELKKQAEQTPEKQAEPLALADQSEKEPAKAPAPQPDPLKEKEKEEEEQQIQKLKTELEAIKQKVNQQNKIIDRLASEPVAQGGGAASTTDFPTQPDTQTRAAWIGVGKKNVFE